jgi:O-methyltransferase involved in polyketide biosynthesis
MADKQRIQLGTVQQTLLITLSARAHETGKRRPLLRDPKAVEMIEAIDFDTAKYGGDAGGPVVVLRTAVLDTWVEAFVRDHPHGTVVELGCGLNTRFERVDNGTVHWIDVDLPDTIELRRTFFEDTDRRRMIAASVLDDDWRQAVADSPGPHFFVAEGVLVYLPENDVLDTLRDIAARFPGALVAFDSYSRRSMAQQHKMADRRKMDARWSWSTDHPLELGDRIGMRLVDWGSPLRPPREIRARLPLGYRLLLPLLDKVFPGFAMLTLFLAE